MTERKLSRCMRKVNLAYKIIMILLGTSNGLFAALESHGLEIPKLYYVIFSVAASFLPVVWSKILDDVKQYHEELTPDQSLDSVSSPSIDSQTQNQ